MVYTQNIYNLLQECKVESDVEEKYKRVLQSFFPKSVINSPHNTDGVLEDPDSNLKLLLELKYNVDLTKRLSLIELLIQLLYYLKKFEMYGEVLPNVVFGGDINECFCLHSNDLLPYLNMGIDWSLAPSEAPFRNPELSKVLYSDNNINPYTFSINNSHFEFKFIVDNILKLLAGVTQKIRITELNINRFFGYFKDRIIRSSGKYNANQLVSIFLNCIIDQNENYLHPKKKNIVVTKPVGEIIVNGLAYEAFFKHFELDYSVLEKVRLTAICDRLIEDEARRFKGEFYTPTEWVLEAHKMIKEVFGVDWKERYVVWDNSWGTGNLTRDFKFKELYCSTLNYGDLITGQNYNPEAVKFQYDFLNDGIEKLPAGLVKAFKENKKIIIFMNPPYGTASGNKSKKKIKKDIAKNRTKNLMKGQKLGDAQKQLYTQFLYKTILLMKEFNTNNISIATFSALTFLVGLYYKNFRALYFDNFKFSTGFGMLSSDFEDVSDWILGFSIWLPGKDNNDTFSFLIKEKDENYIINSSYIKLIYNTDKKMSGNKWVRRNAKNYIRMNGPQISSALNVRQNGKGKTCNDMLGFFYNAGNSIETNTTNQSLLTSAFHGLSQGFPFPCEDTFVKDISSLFSARKLISSNWVNCKDEYLAPNIEHPEYSHWNNDAVVYSLFNGSSNQSSLRKITYKDKIWDIKNEWFWMSNEQMLKLANENGFDELYHDANGDHNRFVYNKLQELTLSEDAKEVLNKAIGLVIKTFPYRKQLHEEYPEWHLNTWDAGWYQIKLILKKYYKDDLEEFKQLYKTFENRMREGVYKFGFLK